MILEVVHNNCYSVHPGGTKMYRDFRQLFWWDNMKKEIVEYEQMLDMSKGEG